MAARVAVPTRLSDGLSFYNCCAGKMLSVHTKASSDPALIDSAGK